MAKNDIHEVIQVRVLKTLNWALFIICILTTIALYKDGRMKEIQSVVVLTGAVFVSMILLSRDQFEWASYLSVSGLVFAASYASSLKLFNPMAIYELGCLMCVAVMLACLLARSRWFALAVGIYGIVLSFIFGFMIQPPLLGLINYTDTAVAIMALVFIIILSDRMFLLTGEIVNHFKQEEFANQMQRKHVALIAEHSESGQQHSQNLEEQTRLGEDLTLSLQNSVQMFSENIHALDSAMQEFILRNNGISQAAGDIMGVFNRHRDGLENYRSKAESISETSQEIDFITQSKRTQLNELMQVTQNGEDRMKKSVSAIEKVAENSKNMLNMISLIMEVAERTNVLALNAAVEASRAGKAGGGFAIVAKEIKNLSTETTQNADVINRSLRSNIKSIEEAVETIRHAGDSFVGINSNLSDFSTAIDDIVRRVNALTEQNVQMSIETKDILTLVDEVQQVLEKMLLSIEQSASKALGLQSTSEGLEGGIQELQTKTSSMRSTIHRIQEIYKDFSYCAVRVGEIVEELSDPEDIQKKTAL